MKTLQKIIGAIAGGLIILSTFLSWVNAGGEMLISGFQNSEGISEGVVILVLGVLVIACSMVGEIWSGIVTALVGIYLVIQVIGMIKVIADYNLGNPGMFELGGGMVLLLIMSGLTVLNSLMGVLYNAQASKT